MQAGLPAREEHVHRGGEDADGDPGVQRGGSVMALLGLAIIFWRIVGIVVAIMAAVQLHEAHPNVAGVLLISTAIGITLDFACFLMESRD